MEYIMELTELFDKYKGLDKDILKIDSYELRAYRQNLSINKSRQYKAEIYKANNPDIIEEAKHIADRLKEILGLEIDLLNSDTKDGHISVARHIFRKYFYDKGLTLEQVGFLEQKPRTHSTIIHSIKAYEDCKYIKYKIKGHTVDQILNMLTECY